MDKVAQRRLKDRAEAESEADKIRTAIRAGQFRGVRDETPAVLTFAELGQLWIKRDRAGKVRKPGNDAACLAKLGAVEVEPGERLAQRAIGRITEDDLERVFAHLPTVAASTRNHYLQAVKALQKWARRKGYIEKPWLGEFTSLKRRTGARRDRRLVPDELAGDGTMKAEGEERRLLAAAGPWMQRVIIAALETGCRRGELLSLQWADVNLQRGELRIRAEKAKTGKTRVLPVSGRLRAVLEMVRLAPDGTEHPPTAFVFGDAIGQRVRHPKRPWLTTCKRAGVAGLHTSTISGTKPVVGYSRPAGRCITCRRCSATPT